MQSEQSLIVDDFVSTFLSSEDTVDTKVIDFIYYLKHMLLMEHDADEMVHIYDLEQSLSNSPYTAEAVQSLMLALEESIAPEVMICADDLDPLLIHLIVEGLGTAESEE